MYRTPGSDAVASVPTTPPPAGRVEIGEFTSPELASAIVAGSDTALLMLASVEQNGPHLSLDKHVVLGRAVAVAIARSVGGILVAPIVPFGRAPEHRGFAGTFDLSESLYLALLEELTENLARAGFHHIVVMSDHGTNREAVTRFTTRAAPGFAQRAVQLAAVDQCYERADSRIEPELVAAGIVTPGSEHSSHAGLLDTSMLMAIAPDRVRSLPAAAGPLELSPAEEQRVATGGIGAVSQSGILGDPRRATPALGHRAFEILVVECVADVRRVLAR